MKRAAILCFAFLNVMFTLNAQKNTSAKVVVNADSGKNIISKHIYGQFSEHLGRCIYEGIWVGENSSIPNIKGYRKDVVDALKTLNIPNLRWPGGCFADEYHWMDGVGPREKRAKMVNTNWGGVVEDNSFGTNEFLDFCELIGTEPYMSGNVGSGSVEEMAKWVEYMTFDGESPMANLRKQNGREKPWKVKFFGVGNESWGCGGSMLPEYYADLFRRYNTYARNYGSNRLFRIASGASDYDTNWTDVLMRKAGNNMDGISLHFYTCKGWSGSKGSALNFTKDEYLWTVSKALELDEIIGKHAAIMDKYDPAKRVGLMVDEWGTWWDVEPGTNPGFLYQQSTLRDAIVAGVSLNVLNSHCDRVKMSNIAQIINVLQSLILTDKEKMVLTPTYYVYMMYKPHKDATLLPLKVESPMLEYNKKPFAAVSASASRDTTGKVHITLVNADPDKAIDVACDLNVAKAFKSVTGQILTSADMKDHNTFDKPNVVVTKDFNGAKISKNGIEVKMPAKSIVVLELKN
jgi:alpha-N-arabinofuranosidase